MFFQRTTPTILGHFVGTNIEGKPIPKGAKLIDCTLECTEADAIKQAGLLETNGYKLIRNYHK